MPEQHQEDFVDSFHEVAERFSKGRVRMAAIEQDLVKATKELHAVREQLNATRQDLSDLLEFFNAMRGAFKVLNWLGKLAKPMAYIVMLGSAVLGLWTAFKTGGLR